MCGVNHSPLCGLAAAKFTQRHLGVQFSQSMTGIVAPCPTFLLATAMLAGLLLPCCGSNGLRGTSGKDGGSGGDAGRGPEGNENGRVGDAGEEPASPWTGQATTSSCSFLPVDPSIEFQPTCSSFTPILGPMEVVLVEQSIIGSVGNRSVLHRFRATAACGFDAVVSLPNLRFASSNQPYQMSTWWSSNGVSTGLLAIVLRRTLPGDVLLAVAVPGSLDLLNSLVSPLAVTMHGPTCTDPAQANKTSQILESGGTPLSCEDQDGGYALRFCSDRVSASTTMVAYRGLPDTTALPAVFGASNMLSAVE